YYSSASNGSTVNFEIRLYEGQQRFDLIYGVLNGNGGSATVGAQKGTGSSFTQFECNAGGLSNGLQLSFQGIICPDGGGTCGGPMADFTAKPHERPGAPDGLLHQPEHRCDQLQLGLWGRQHQHGHQPCEYLCQRRQLH